MDIDDRLLDLKIKKIELNLEKSKDLHYFYLSFEVDF